MKDYSKIKENVIEGNTNPLIAYAEIKDHIKLLTEDLKEIEDIAREEALKQDNKIFELKGYKFELRNGATRYSFKNIKEWCDKSKEIKEIESKYKQVYLSAIKGLSSLSEDAEIMEMPEVTYNKESIVVKKIY